MAGPGSQAGTMGDKPKIRFLRAWREYRDISQEALGAKIGFTQGMISQLENGDTDFTGNHLELLSQALQCTAYDLQFRHPADENDPLAAVLALPEAVRPLAVKLIRQLPQNLP